MVLNLIAEMTEPQNRRHAAMAKRFMTRPEEKHVIYALPALESTSSGHTGDAAAPDATPRFGVDSAARAYLRRLRVEAARPAAVTSTYTITEADIDNLDRVKRDLGDLLAPLNASDPDAFAQGCQLMARLDRVIWRAQATEQRPDDAA